MGRDSVDGIANCYGMKGLGIESSTSQWPNGLRRGSAADRLLGLRVRLPIPVAERSKAMVNGRSLVGIAVSKSTGGIDVCVV